MNRLGIKVLLWCALPALTGRAQSDTTLTYRVEASANVSSGDYAPLWFTAGLLFETVCRARNRTVLICVRGLLIVNLLIMVGGLEPGWIWLRP